MTAPDRDLLISAPQLLAWRLHQWARKICGPFLARINPRTPRT